MKYKDSFTTIPDWLYDDDRIEGLSELIIAAIINGFSHDDQGQFHGSIEYLARKIKVKRRAVQRILRKLQSQGVIICDGIHQQYKTNIYRYIPINDDLKRHRVIMTPPCHKDAPEGVIKTPNSIVDNIENKKEKKILKEKLPVKTRDKRFDDEKEQFGRQVLKASEGKKYHDAMVEAFFEYWAETNDGSYVMRFQKEKTFGTALRLATWKSNKDKWQTNGKKSKPKEEMTLTERWERTSYE